MGDKWESSGATKHAKECHWQFDWVDPKTVRISPYMYARKIRKGSENDDLAVDNKDDNKSSLQAEKIKIDFQKRFEQNGLKITIRFNFKVVDFLDVTLNLTVSNYRPYHNPNDAFVTFFLWI